MEKSIDKLPPVKLTYLDSLDSVTKARYLEKLSIIDKTDPYTVQKGKWSQKTEEFPNILYPDIVNYLLYTPSKYTTEDLKAYKSLDAYNQLVCGWVREVSTTEINDVNVIIAKVMHSQRMNDTPLRPWIIAEKGGKIISAHCDCMAGLGEACTHIAATLFWVDATVRIRETKTVTQEKAYWMLPTGVKKIAYSQLSDIDFRSAKSKKVLLDKHINNEKVKTVQRNVTVSAPTPGELDSFFKELSMAGSKPAILSLIPQYSDQYIPAPLSKQFPAVLTDLCNHDSFNLEFDDLKHKCENIKITVNEEEAQNVFVATKLQSKSKMWFRFRAGRITASRMKEVCRTNLTKPSESLIKSVCYPGENKFTNAATRWGCEHEKSAINEYLKTMSEVHDNIQVNESGLILNPAHPHLGASPDGLVVCDCCGEGCIEVKCPYCIRDCKLEETVVIKTCLKASDGIFQLNRAHKYYYQVQTQLLLSDNDYVDFVLWTMKGLHIERIEPDAEVFAEIIAKSKEFFNKGVLPELVGKFYTRSRVPLQSSTATNDLPNEQEKETFCVCKGPEFGRMVQCDNENCKIVWFHFKCLKLRQAPKGKWLCPLCT